MLKPVNHTNHEFSVDVHVQGTQMYCGSELALAVKREAEDVLVLLCAYVMMDLVVGHCITFCLQHRRTPR